jgi:acetolactate synthase-1/2/3 large subunit
MTTAEALVESLIRHGVTTVFGLPGMHNDPLFDALYLAKNRVRTIHTRHEQTAAYMALGAALATGKPQTYSVVPGPGFLSSTAALLTAFAMNAPVLALAGQIRQHDIDRGHGWLHEIRDQKGIAGHITKFAARIAAPHEAPGLVRDALAAACSGRQRPVFLECGMDVWGQRGEVAFPDMPVPATVPPVDLDAVDAAAKLLGAAENPIIVVGGGAQDASAEVTALAEMLQAPVVAYRRGRGVVASSHPLSVTVPIGHRLWADADAVLAIGTRFMVQHNEWGVDAGLKVVRLDIDAEEHNRWRKPDVALIGDAASTAAALLDRLPAFNTRRASRSEEMNGHRAWLAGRLKDLQPQVGWLEAIRKVLPPEGIFVDEVTQAGFAARVAFPVEKPRTFLSPGYQDNLGWGLGTALGAKVAKPDVPVVLISGDGGFLFQVGDLATAVQHNIAVIIIVFDNGMYGNVRRMQSELFGGRHIACDLQNPDFVALAKSFNMAAFLARDAAALEDALKQAVALKSPALIHVPHGETGNPWPFIRMPRVRG